MTVVVRSVDDDRVCRGQRADRLNGCSGAADPATRQPLAVTWKIAKPVAMQDLRRRGPSLCHVRHHRAPTM